MAKKSSSLLGKWWEGGRNEGDVYAQRHRNIPPSRNVKRELPEVSSAWGRGADKGRRAQNTGVTIPQTEASFPFGRLGPLNFSLFS